jgi:hypothetical protein
MTGGDGGMGSRLKQMDPNAIVLGVAVALAVVILVAGIAIYASAGGDDGSARVAATEDSTTSTRAESTATSTTAPSASSTTAPTSSTLPVTGGGTGTTSPPTPRATADPEEDPFVPVPLPAGLGGVTLDSCFWTQDGGGQLVATGTITSTLDDDLWGVEVYWLQNDRELDSQYEIYDFEAAGQTVPWRLTIEAPLAPADLRCEIIVD